MALSSLTVADSQARGDKRKRLGRKGEVLAARYLERKGYKIVQTNYRSRYGELDIIARNGRTIAFIEVKTRLNRHFGEPFEAVTQYKQGKIRNMAQAWLLRHNKDDYENCEYRFDVVSILMYESGTVRDLRHFKDAFR